MFENDELTQEILRILKHLSVLIPGSKEYNETLASLEKLLSVKMKTEEAEFSWKKFLQQPAVISTLGAGFTTFMILIFETRGTIMSSAFRWIRFK